MVSQTTKLHLFCRYCEEWRIEERLLIYLDRCKINSGERIFGE